MAVKNQKRGKPLGYQRWFKAVLAVLTFAPLITSQPYDYSKTQQIISSVLENPLINQVDWLKPVSKLLLLAIAAWTLQRKNSRRNPLMLYYAICLFAFGVFQNLAVTDSGFTLITGNLLCNWAVGFYCLYDFLKGKSWMNSKCLKKGRLWLVAPMLFAFLFPYTIRGEIIIPSFSNILTNEACLTYCMLTSILLGLMLLFPDGVSGSTLSLLSFVGLWYGALNLITFFVLDPVNWWMGVLHIPLVIISSCGAAEAYAKGRTSKWKTDSSLPS